VEQDRTGQDRIDLPPLRITNYLVHQYLAIRRNKEGGEEKRRKTQQQQVTVLRYHSSIDT
jgi:hypothetical protein